MKKGRKGYAAQTNRLSRYDAELIERPTEKQAIDNFHHPYQ